jgi:hypothetical protein
LLSFCPGWPWTVIFLISASWVARISGMSHPYLGDCLGKWAQWVNSAWPVLLRMSLLKLSLSLNKRKTRFCNNAYLNFGKSRTLILININIDAVQSSFHGRLCSVHCEGLCSHLQS